MMNKVRMINVLIIDEKADIQKNDYLCSFKTQKYRHVGYHFFQTQ
ncbi:hypothetical protein REB14_17680 [Chryseobacterium sp. ES2]|uniref:Uncharacterized protein n=1 Tax=Chryseobacterium metallicongregator TaxID=3073042 RepID=A0ABU1E871_9FLAO|nr:MULTISPECIES: hypothetical protein [Chryseobacterium]MDR4954014.1 hypothetical protein [Chryseobacterium sp. ES2]